MRSAASGRWPAAVLAAALLGAAVGAGAVGLSGGEAGGDAAVAPVASASASPAVGPVGAALETEILSATCGLLAVRGDHADWLADGRYCRLRLAVTNTQRTTHVWDAARQEVVDSTGARHAANLNATQIADQPTTVEVKPGNRLELDAWFDVPEDAHITAARLTAPVTRAHREAAGGDVVTTTWPVSPVDAMAAEQAAG